MAKEYAKEFYQSMAWRRTREVYRKSVGGLCERCRRKGIYRPAEIVHHIKHITPDNISDTGVTLSFENLMAVCRECHAELHGAAKDQRWTVDEYGRVAPLNVF